MKNIFFIILFLFSLILNGKDIYYTPRSNKVFSSDELRSFIIDVAYEAINDSTIPKSIFKHKFLSVEEKLLQKTQYEITERFKRIEDKNGFLFENKQLYKTELRSVINQTILEQPSIYGPISMDHSDRILKFYSDIEVKDDGRLQVKEYITIYNGNGEQSELYTTGVLPYNSEINNEINHGIFRDFPTLYTSSLGLKSTIPLQIKRILRNGNQEKCTTQSMDNGVRVYIGNPEMLLPMGIHYYIIEYETKYQLKFHENKDELYWNVNGNGWNFSVDSAFCQVTFPSKAIIIEQACYTGLQGSTERNCVCKPGNSSTILFYTDSKLNREQGLTIAASIQKGIVLPPSISENIYNIIKPNWQLVAMLGTFLSLLGMNLFYWYRLGNDPEQGTIYMQFDPPGGLSPAAVGFIYSQAYKPEQFSAALVDMAIKKAVVINVEEHGVSFFKTYSYKFTKPDYVDPGLYDDAKKLYQWDLKRLFNLKVTTTYNPSLADFGRRLKDHLSKNFQIDYKKNKDKKGLFAVNRTPLIIGAIILVISAFGVLFSLGSHPSGMLIILFCLVFIAALIMQYVFSKILPAYTIEGMKLRDQIEGLKMYLSTAEEKRYDTLNAPEKSIETFEKFLPYAIALDCQIQWSSTFENILQQAILDNAYQPNYYRGHVGTHFAISTFNSSLSSGLSSAISSASTVPSSSSGGGSSGGGSSGGGGGGGGGGGW